MEGAIFFSEMGGMLSGPAEPLILVRLISQWILSILQSILSRDTSSVTSESVSGRTPLSWVPTDTKDSFSSSALAQLSQPLVYLGTNPILHCLDRWMHRSRDESLASYRLFSLDGMCVKVKFNFHPIQL